MPEVVAAGVIAVLCVAMVVLIEANFSAYFVGDTDTRVRCVGIWLVRLEIHLQYLLRQINNSNLSDQDNIYAEIES